MRRSAPLVALVLVLAACGSGQNPVVEGAAGPTTTSTTGIAAAGDTLPPTGDAVVTGDTATAGGAEGTDSAPSGDDGNGSSTDPGGSAGDVPSGSAFPPPAAGTYTFHTTGTGPPASLLGPPSQIDEQSITTVTALSADTVRQSSTVAGGTQTTDLRYESSRVALLLLEVTFSGQTLRFPSTDGITFVPLPPTAGQTWSGQLVDESGQLTANFSGSTLPGETITVGGRTVDAFRIDATVQITGTFSGFPVDATVLLQAWLDPALRTSVRTHQVSTIRQPIASNSDTTSELVGFTPA